MLSEHEALVLVGMVSAERGTYPFRLSEVIKRAQDAAKSTGTSIQSGEVARALDQLEAQHLIVVVTLASPLVHRSFGYRPTDPKAINRALERAGFLPPADVPAPGPRIRPSGLADMR
jgi:hypothetical protein